MLQKISDFFHRYGVLISVAYTAASVIGTYVPTVGQVTSVLGSVFSLLGFTTDPAASASVTAAITAGISLYGVIVKSIKLAKPAPAPVPPPQG